MKKIENKERKGRRKNEKWREGRKAGRKKGRKKPVVVELNKPTKKWNSKQGHQRARLRGLA